GMGVVLQLSLDRKAVHAVTVQRPSLHGSVKKVDAKKGTITIASKGRDGVEEKTFALAKGDRVDIADAEGDKKGKLADLAEDVIVVAQLSLDRKTVREITAHGPTLHGVLKGVDAGADSITVEIKDEGGNLVEKTIEVTRHTAIHLEDGKKDEKVKLTDLAVGFSVSVKLSVDQERAVAIRAKKPK